MSDDAPAPARPATFRAVLIALAAVAALAWFTPFNDYDLQNTYLAGNLFPIGAMVVLLGLVLGLNPILIRLAPRHRFRPSELALIWGVIAIASGIPAAGYLRYLLPQQVAVINFATPENHWLGQLVPHLRPWMIPQDPLAATNFYRGSAGGAIPWSDWRAPLLLWATAAAQLFFACACVTVLLRRQWDERERFSFPLIQLPLVVSQPVPPGRGLNDFFRNPVVWAGAMIPMIVHGVNGLHLYFPGVPQLDLHYNAAQHLPKVRPWNVVGSFPLHIYPMTIGFAYLLAQEIAFSMWFFRLFEVLQQVFFVQTNLAVAGNDIRKFGCMEAYGAVLALAVMVVILARPHLHAVWRQALGGGGLDDSREAMRYRTAVIGLALSLLGLFATFVQFGLAPAMAAVVLLVGLAKYVAASWGATNAGLMMVQQQFRASDLMVAAFGSRAFGPATLVNGAQVENVFWYDLRETLMPSLFNAAKLSSETDLSQRSTFRWGALAIALAAGLAAWAWLALAYDRGATQLAPTTFVGHATRVWTEAMTRLEPGEPASGFYLFSTALGGGLFFGLMALRLRFVAWPLHPIGLVSMYSWTSNQFGFSFFVGWASKALLVRLGGLRLYSRCRPFFLGIILGDVISAVVMTAVGFIWGQGYFVTPN